MMTRQGAAATLRKSIEVSAITTASFPFIHISKDTNHRVQPCSYHGLVSLPSVKSCTITREL